ncbi:hypothetical protein EXIGLDRAFT_709287 [Exidia glandulosa HHB12029]|uniref:Extracellular metalloproteinase n=1 Tax=Exidia glandulosa HHB12029 TaxID=1314781 RepID=A0A165IWF1_EXIGL|nr:hypothetical protein EXIGLDRAFT_709287 [Exidia glandulosa HHB12029]
MVALTPAFATLAFFCASAIAAPWPTNSKHATHQVRELPNGVKVQSYHPESSFEIFGDGVKHPLSTRAGPVHFKDAGLAFIGSRLGGEDKFALKSSSDGATASHVYVSQRFNGINVANAVANVALNKAGKVVSFGSSFIKPTRIASAVPKLSVDEAVSKASSFLDGAANEIAPKLEYYSLDDGSLALAHAVQLELSNGHLVEAFVDAHTGDVLGMTDFTNDLTVRVVPIQKQSPLDGFEDIVDPEDPISSPQGWTTLNGADTGVTSGNNAIGFKSSQTTGLSSETGPDEFLYTFNPAAAPTVSPNVDAARVNSWYIVNSIHDITYRYGFTESAFNFQNDNFGKGGAGNDRVTVSAQDSAGTNNADFTTPPDGQSGRMRMFQFTITNPRRDGDLENDIVAHENTHGLSNRLTGGGTGACLQAREAGGMGEGWSDAFAEWTEQNGPTIHDFTTGTYVLNNTAGVRSFPYSTSKTVNPLTYASLQTRTEVHDIGEIWANTLHVVLDALVTSLGFSENAKTNPDQDGGNVVWFHLFVDALALQPCNPTFLSARAAWIQADANRYAGANACTLWKAFASRGLGVNAANHVDNADVPAECA